jgi:tetratricopeptide (TPR) repeat protein
MGKTQQGDKMDLGQAMQDEITRAPSYFVQIWDRLGEKNIQAARTQIESILPKIDTLDEEWKGPIYCCYAYCLKEMGEYEKALTHAMIGSAFRLNNIGGWYFYESIVDALNYTDKLDDALAFSRDAVQFFLEGSVFQTACYHLEKQANILKQLASSYSHDVSKISAAKEYTIEAIRALCTSLSMFPEGWEESHDELDGMSRVAARASVRRKDLSFLDELPNIEEITERYFGEEMLRRGAAVECFNMAVESRKDGKRAIAKQWYEKALEAALETRPQDRVFKAFVAYNHGINLLKMYNVEDTKPSANLESETQQAIHQIRRAWGLALQLHSTLTPEYLASSNEAFVKELISVVPKILADPLMSDWSDSKPG